MSDAANPNADTRLHPRNTLLLRSAIEEDVMGDCIEQVDESTGRPSSVVLVTLDQNPVRILQPWLDRAGAKTPTHITLIHWGAESPLERPSIEPPADLELTITSVPSPGNLTQLGVAISNVLGEWGESGVRPVVCFRSITAILQYADPQTVYQFLNAMTDQVHAVGGTGHYHLDPASYDDKTVHRLASMFDETVRADSEHE